ncbi:MAG: CBS domain-containing protein [Polyangiaceae bacterium]|nr:CBS domain-containing protein [Polyangiaceae bacterium]MCB9610413.1 CBS domain-containing protein [Polyangiaceae bacterium]
MVDSRSVADVMTKDPETVDPNDQLLNAEQLMNNHRFRHLPVVDEDGLLVGVLSQRDLFHSALLKCAGFGQHGIDKLLDMFLVKEAMKTDIVSITPDAPLSAAAELMLERKLGCLPVLDGDRLVGILTESDFVRLAAALDD